MEKVGIGAFKKGSVFRLKRTGPVHSRGAAGQAEAVFEVVRKEPETGCAVPVPESEPIVGSAISEEGGGASILVAGPESEK